MAVAEEDLSLLPVAVVDPKFVRAYENPRFVPAKGGAPVLAQVAPGGDIATVRDDGRLPDDSKQGFSVAFTGLLVAGQPVRASYCGVCQMWFGKFMEETRARNTHCRTDPGHVSRAAHAQQLARKRDSRAKTKATGRAEDSWENSSDRYRSEDTSQWSDATSNTAERDHADRLHTALERQAEKRQKLTLAFDVQPPSDGLDRTVSASNADPDGEITPAASRMDARANAPAPAPAPAPGSGSGPAAGAKDHDEYWKRLDKLRPHRNFAMRYIQTLDKFTDKTVKDIAASNDENLKVTLTKKRKVAEIVRKYLWLLCRLCNDEPGRGGRQMPPNLRVLDVIHKTLEAVYKRKRVCSERLQVAPALTACLKGSEVTSGTGSAPTPARGASVRTASNRVSFPDADSGGFRSSVVQDAVAAELAARSSYEVSSSSPLLGSNDGD